MRGLAKKSQIEEILTIFEKKLCFFGQQFGSTQQHFPIGNYFIQTLRPEHSKFACKSKTNLTIWK
jgi:hypothetical protein